MTETIKWFTGENPKVGRVACPRLIKRFIDELELPVFGESAGSIRDNREAGQPAWDSAI